MKISAIGERGLIERIRRLLDRPRHALLGVGDDCAALRLTPDRDLLLTTDILVEQVDFTRKTITPFHLGRKAMAVNLSDIAAMGGLPRAALVVLALPPDTETDFVEELYGGLQEEGRRYGVEVIGGDLSASSTLMIGVTLVGEVEAGRAVMRSGAKPGDRIWITGGLGASAAGLAAIQAGFRLQHDRVEAPYDLSADLETAIHAALERHLYPVPRVREGRALASASVASAMIDLSDGLASDLVLLCRESGVSARIVEDRIPIDPAASVVAQHLGRDPMGMALRGGEDFELLFTSSAHDGEITELFSDNQTVTNVGEIRESGRGYLLLQRTGDEVPLAGGFDHFRQKWHGES